MRRWWRRKRVSEDIATEVDNGNTTLAVPWWERLITVVLWIAVGAFLMGTLLSVMFATSVPSWVGVQAVEVTDPNVRQYIPQKTLWDWFGLIAIPLAIVVVGYILNRSDRAHERRLQDQRMRESRVIEEQRIAENRQLANEQHQDDLLYGYLRDMKTLLLHEGLRTSNDRDEVRSVARVQTALALAALDSGRKSTVLRFLHEAHLIGSPARSSGIRGGNAVIHDLSRVDLRGAILEDLTFDGITLSDANLEHAHLNRISLVEADLTGANLTRASLSYADLRHADLRYSDLEAAHLTGATLCHTVFDEADLTSAFLSLADLRGAYLGLAYLDDITLTGANLSDAHLSTAYLDGAVLRRANLTRADLRGASLIGADLTDANLTEAYMTGADLTESVVTSEQLCQAYSLRHVKLPDHINPADLGAKWSPPQDETAPSSSAPVH